MWQLDVEKTVLSIWLTLRSGRLVSIIHLSMLSFHNSQSDYHPHFDLLSMTSDVQGQANEGTQWIFTRYYKGEFWVHMALTKISSCLAYETNRWGTEQWSRKQQGGYGGMPPRNFWNVEVQKYHFQHFFHIPQLCNVTCINLVAFVHFCVFQRSILVDVLFLPFSYCYFLFIVALFLGALLVLFYYESSSGSCS